MAQHDYDINSTDSISGYQFRQDTNSALSAIKSSNSGSSAPLSPVAGMLWMDTSTIPNKLKVRDGSNTSWLDFNQENSLGAPIVASTSTTIGTFGYGGVIHITGNSTITSFGASVTGTHRLLIFDGAPTITHNGVSLVCPGEVNVVVYPGTTISVMCEDGALGYWRVLSVHNPHISLTELEYLDGVSSNVQTQLNSKAPINSPTLTGTPTAPTASITTSTTQLATTAFATPRTSNIGATVLPSGTTVERPTGAMGYLRGNTTTSNLEAYTSEWSNILTEYTSKYKVCRVVSIFNTALSGLYSIDGVMLVAGDRVLVVNQNNGTTNGIYVASSTAWSRATDYDTAIKISGTTIGILEGLYYKGAKFSCTLSKNAIVGTSSIVFLRNIVEDGLNYNISCKGLYATEAVCNTSVLSGSVSIADMDDLLYRYTWTATTNIIASNTTAINFMAAPMTKRYILIVLIGGGGGGAPGIIGELGNKAGGAGGHVTVYLLDTTMLPISATTTLSYKAQIGSGGAGGTATTYAGGGGITSLDIFISTDLVTPVMQLYADGGSAEVYAGTGTYPNTYRVPMSSSIFFDGSFGTGDNGTTSFAGYGGGATFLARGGNGGNALATPTAGTAGAANTGAGGGAGALYNNTTRTNGGAGGSGKIIIYYPS